MSSEPGIEIFTRPERPTRSPVDRVLVRQLLVVLVVSAVLGLLYFVATSSRGLDIYELGLTLAGIAFIALTVGALVGIGRKVLLGENLVLLAVPVSAIGVLFGLTLAARIVPGDTTDGTYRLQLPDPNRPADMGGIVCVWRDGSVVEVRSRRTISIDDLPPAERVRIVLPAGDVTVEETGPGSAENGSPKTFPGVAGPIDPSGRTGQAVLGSATMAWDCPAR
jgi:hypothetical protein